MEKEFEEFWKLHQKQLLSKAPEKYTAELKDSRSLNTAGDWLLLLFELVPGIYFTQAGYLRNEMLNFICGVVVIFVCMAVGEMLKPYVTGKRSSGDIVNDIKQYYYNRYKENGTLDGLL